MTQNEGWGPPPGTQPGYSPPGAPPPGSPPPGTQPPPQWSPPPGAQPPPQWSPPPLPSPSGAPTKYCPSCGSVIDSRSIDCPRCGVRQPDAVYTEPRSRPIAILLALFLGSFGVHRFYLGPIAWGFIYLIFFWTGIPGIIAWFEALYFLTRNDVEWAQTYGGPVQRSSGVAIGCLWILALLPLILLVLSIAAVGGLILVGGEIESILSEISTEI